jgi:hypothetical protein
MHTIAVYALTVGFVLLVAASITGCTVLGSKSVFEDGSYHEQMVLVPPFGKLAEGTGDYSVQVNADGTYAVNVGGSLKDTDNTAQVEAMKSLAEAVAAITATQATQAGTLSSALGIIETAIAGR